MVLCTFFLQPLVSNIQLHPTCTPILSLCVLLPQSSAFSSPSLVQVIDLSFRHRVTKIFEACTGGHATVRETWGRTSYVTHNILGVIKAITG